MDVEYNRLRLLEGDASMLLLRYAEKRFGDSCLEFAWEQFCDANESPYTEHDPQYTYFLRWFEYDWRPEDTKTLAGLLLSDRGSRIDPDVRRVMEATLSAPYSFYQVVDIERGAGLRLRDVLRRKDVQVTERTASSTLEKGNILLARVVEMDGIAFMMGNGTQPLRATYLSALLKLRTDLEEAGPLDKEPDGSDILLDSEEDLRDAYFSLIDAMFDMLTDIRNVDGDPLVLHKLRYGIPAFESAFRALQDLNQKAGHAINARITDDGEITEDGIPVRGRILWLKKKRREQHEFSTIATLTFTETTLVVEVNSEKRSKLIQKEIASRLGKRATLMHIDITPAEGMMKQALEEMPGNKAQPETDDERRFKESPEMRQFMKDRMEKHWESWPDTAVPALRGLTPRQAAKDKVGRELLESLLLEFEVRMAKQKDESNRVDVAKLRRELGLKERS